MSHLSALVALPSSNHPTTWLNGLLHPGSTAVQPLSSYPNLNLLEHPAASVAQTVFPGYEGQPAPMGIADYGLGSTPYTYSPSHILGSLTLNAPPNVTDPGAQAVIDPGESTLGAVGSVYEWGLQLNTILTNVSLPGTNNGVFWTQNVLNINDTGIHFVQDIFNFTTTSFYIPPTGTFLSGCGSTDLSAMLNTYGGVYQCVGGTIPISPADYPLTIDLYNNVTITAQNETQLVFGGEITGALGTLSSGPIDTVVFNNPNASVAPPPFPVGFTVSGTTTSPVGLLYDSELDLVGSIGGDNAVFRSVNGSLSLGYSNATSGPFTSVPSAYNFGSDTGETSTGIAATWSGTTENINQGPSFLYGLWGAVPSISVPSGSIQLSGSVTPNYGFVFLSNVDPSTVPNLTGTNMSWVPTDAAGDFTTYLPPSVPPSTQYYVQAFAPGEAVYTGTPFSTSQTSYAITMTSAPGTLNAPIYMRNNAQADALAAAVGTSSPDTFSNLVVNLNYTFNHLNDYGFPSFVIFSAEQVTVPLYVNNVSQGFDSPLGNFYYYDNPVSGGATGYLTPGAQIIPYSLENYSEQFQLFDSTAVTITNESFLGMAFASFGSAQGGSAFLWKDTGAVVKNVTVGAGYDYDFAGVFVGDSTGTVVQSVTVSGGSNGVVDVGSTGTAISWVNATGGGTFGIYGLSSSHGSYSWINATGGAYGVYAGGYTGYAYYAIPGITSSTITNVVAYLSGSIGVQAAYSSHVSVTHLAAWGAATIGEISLLSDHMALTGLATNASDYAGAVFEADANDTITAVSVTEGGLGVELEVSTSEMVSNVTATLGGEGIVDYAGAGDTITGLTANDGICGETDSASGVTVSNVVATNGSDGFGTFGSSSDMITGVVAANDSLGVYSLGSVGDSVSGVTAWNNSLGVEDQFTTNDTISNVTATTGSQGVGSSISSGTLISHVSASAQSLGVESYETEYDSISHVTATDGSVAVYVDYYAEYLTVSDVSAANASLGVYLDYEIFLSTVSGVSVTNQSIAVATYYVQFVSVTNVVATNATLGGPNTLVPEVDYPILGYAPVTAVFSQASSDLMVSNVVATNYPAGLLDSYSGYCVDYFQGFCYESASPTTDGLYVSNLNVTGGTIAVGLQDTANSSFVGIGAFQDYIGFESDYGVMDSLSQSSFVDSVLWGVYLDYGLNNVVWDNNFVGNNGATSTYDSTHIQGYDTGSVGDTWYFCAPGGGCIGNYWADWHTYLADGNLAPYKIQGSGWDYYPIGAPEGMFAVSFAESGLPSGSSWSVTFNGATHTSTASAISFVAAPGSYGFSVGVPSGYLASPTTGTATVSSSGANVVTIAFQAVYTVTLTESGLPSGTNWTANFDGVSNSTSSASMTFAVTAGTYAYQVGSISGYTVSPASGTVTVAGTYAIAVDYSPVSVPTYAVTLSAGGLSASTTWSATVNGVTQSTTGPSLVFYLPDGNYSYSFNAVAGYNLGTGASGTVTVSGAPVSESASYAAKSTPSVASSSDLTNYFAVALVIGLIALVIAIVALLLKRGGRSGAQTPPEAWKGPTSGETSGEGSTGWKESGAPGSEGPKGN